MNTALAFFKTDLIGIRRWFEESTFSKLFVIFGFLGVFSFIFFIFNLGSDVFFSLLSGYRQFGLLVSEYLINAAIVIIMILSVASSYFATLTLLYRQHSEIETSLVLPVKHSQLIIWIFSKSVFANMVFFSFIFFPILLSFNKHFGTLPIYLFLLKVILVSLLIVFTTNAIGSLISFITAKAFTKYKGPVVLISLFTVISISITLLKIIFPTSLYNLYIVQNDQFMSVYNSLPLSNSYLPSSILTKILTENFPLIPFMTWLILTAAITYLSLYYQQKALRKVWQAIQDRNEDKKSKSSILLFSNRTFFFQHRSYSFIAKDIFAILRTPQEAGYSLFLILCSLLFFILIAQVRRFQPDQTAYRTELIMSSFVWLFFFAIAFFLRTIFPLISKEGNSKWHLYALPIRPSNIMLYKTITALILAIPFIFISFFELVVLKVGNSQGIVLFPITFIGVLLLSFVSVVLGAIFPNYKYADEPEKVSTSMMGIVALLVSLSITAFLSFMIYMIFKMQIKGLDVLILVASVAVFITGMMYLLQRVAQKQFIEH